jgi:hypothetical protein
MRVSNTAASAAKILDDTAPRGPEPPLIGGPGNTKPSAAIRRRPNAGSSIDFATIAREALASLPAILRRLLPSGRVIGREYIALNPTRIDHHAGSFKVHLTGPRAGAWADFATGDRGGDVISLVAYLEDIRQHEAARLVARMLGIDVQGAHHG